MLSTCERTERGDGGWNRGTEQQERGGGESVEIGLKAVLMGNAVLF